MHMICHAANFDGQSAKAFDDSTDVSEDARQVFQTQLYTCTLYVVYQVYVYFNQCTCHFILSPLRG